MGAILYHFDWFGLGCDLWRRGRNFAYGQIAEDLWRRKNSAMSLSQACLKNLKLERKCDLIFWWPKDPLNVPGQTICDMGQWEDRCTQKGGSMRHVDWTGAWTTPKQHTHTHFQNLNTLSPTIHVWCFEFRVLKVLRNTQMFYLVELTLLTCLQIFVYKIASGSPKAWVWVC